MPHSLGALPKVILLMITGTAGYGKITILVATKYKNGPVYSYMNKIGTENTGKDITDIFDVYYNAETSTPANVTATETTVKFTNQSSYYFQSGGTYKYLLLR